MSRSRDLGSAAGSLAAPSSSYNGYAYVVDSTQASGWNYIPTNYAGKNKLLNGDMSFWQRGITFGSSGVYTADMWLSDNPTTTRSTSAPNGFAYSLQVSNAPGNPAIRQGIELPGAGLAGQFAIGTTWTMSFYAKVSTTTSAQMYAFACFNTGVNAATDVQLANISVGIPTTSWQRYSATFTITSSPISTSNVLMFVPYLNSGAYSGNWNITGLQIEQGTIATPFALASGTPQQELNSCEYYYQRFPLQTNNLNYGMVAICVFENSSTAWGPAKLKRTMRVPPTCSIIYTNLATNYGSHGPVICDTNQTTKDIATFGWSNGSGGAVGYATYLRASADSGAYWEASAVL